MARAMKASGIPWIGLIGNEFSVYRLKFLLSEPLTYGANESGIPFDESLPRYIRITDISSDGKLKNDNKLSLSIEAAKDYLLKENDILLARSGASVGKAFIFKAEYGISAFAGYLIRARLKQNISSQYVFYYTQSALYDEWKKQTFIQSTIQNIGADRYNQLPVVLPCRQKQDAIVARLNAECARIDAVMEQTRASIEEYKKLKQSIITEAVTKGIRPNRPMKDSGIEWIGQIPNNWNIEKGKRIFQKLERPVLDDDGVITCFRDGEVTLRSKRREEGFTFSLQEIGYQGIEVGDLVVHGMDGFAGAIGVSDSRGKGTPVLNVLDSQQDKRYMMYYLRSMAFNGVFIALATGIRVRTCDTNWNKLKELPYPLPSIEEQNEIAEHIDKKNAEIDALISKKEKFLAEIESYKKSMIFEYVTGKKEVV